MNAYRAARNFFINFANTNGRPAPFQQGAAIGLEISRQRDSSRYYYRDLAIVLELSHIVAFVERTNLLLVARYKYASRLGELYHLLISILYIIKSF